MALFQIRNLVLCCVPTSFFLLFKSLKIQMYGAEPSETLLERVPQQYSPRPLLQWPTKLAGASAAAAGKPVSARRGSAGAAEMETDVTYQQSWAKWIGNAITHVCNYRGQPTTEALLNPTAAEFLSQLALGGLNGYTDWAPEDIDLLSGKCNVVPPAAPKKFHVGVFGDSGAVYYNKKRRDPALVAPAQHLLRRL